MGRLGQTGFSSTVQPLSAKLPAVGESKTIGRFAIERAVGAGGMGEVFSAIDGTTGERVALKRMRSGGGDSERFAREASLLAALVHPGIVRYVAHGTTATNEMFLAMEWLEGVDLEAHLERAPLSLFESVGLVRRAAEALGHAHGFGVVHRDVKPSNLFLVDGDPARVKVIDFGIARIARPRYATRSGVVLGTPGYMAPEQARGDRALDARVDVFALGCVLFECLTGRPAFVAETVMALLAKILFQEAPRLREFLPDAPIELEELVATLLAKSPAVRPENGARVAAALAEIEPRLGASARADAQRTGANGVVATSLTRSERRLVSVVMGRIANDSEGRVENAATLTPRVFGHRMDALHQVSLPFGGRIEPLADGSLAFFSMDDGVATDQAARAARCALALHAALPDCELALTTGRATSDGPRVVGEAIDRAAKLLRTHRTAGTDLGRASRAIFVDETSAGLLDVQFQIGGGPQGLELLGERDVSNPPRTLIGKETPCVGREREIAGLRATFEECASESTARVVLVTAAAGMGKSRLRHELVNVLRATGAPHELWLGRADPMTSGSPFALLAAALRRGFGIFEGELPEVQRRKLAARVGRNVPADDVARVACFLGVLLSIPTSGDEGPDLKAARTDARLMGDQIRAAFEDLMRAETSALPLVLVLEDAHCGDRPTMNLVDAALRYCADRPLFVLALSRPEIHETFPRLWEAREVQEVRLPALSKKASERLIADVLGERATPELAATLVQRSGGNAFALEELLRAVIAGRGAALPETAVAMMQTRIEALDPEARLVLRASSIFGATFWEGGARAVLRGTSIAEQVGSRLEALTREELILEQRLSRFPGQREFRFRHVLVREAACETFTSADRALAHRLAGAWLEERGESDLLVMAEHASGGGDALRAARFLLRAARLALEGNDHQGAIDRAGEALRSYELAAQTNAHGTSAIEPDRIVELELIIAEALHWGATPARAIEAARKAVARSVRGSAPWCHATGLLAMGLARSAATAAAIDVVSDLIASDPQPDAVASFLYWLSWAVVPLHTTGHAVVLRAAEVARALGDRFPELDPVSRGSIHILEAFERTQRGDFAGALAARTSSVQVGELLGNRRAITGTKVGLGNANLRLGRPEQAERYFREGIASAERLGLSQVETAARHNLGLALSWLGRHDDALATEQAAFAAAAALGPRFAGNCQNYLALIAIAAGHPARAVESARKAVELLVPFPNFLCFAEATLALALLADGRPTEALEASRRSIALLASGVHMSEGEGIVLLAHAETLIAIHDVDGARSWLVDAVRTLERRAEAISDSAMRESFLAGVPEHARIRQLAAD